DYKLFVCLPIPVFAPKGSVAVLRPHGTPSETATGVATFQRRPAALATRVFTTAPTSGVSLVKNLGSCAAPATTSTPLKLLRLESFFYPDIFRGDFDSYKAAKSWLFTAASSTLGCVKWDPAELDSLLS